MASANVHTHTRNPAIGVDPEDVIDAVTVNQSGFGQGERGRDGKLNGAGSVEANPDIGIIRKGHIDRTPARVIAHNRADKADGPLKTLARLILDGCLGPGMDARQLIGWNFRLPFNAPLAHEAKQLCSGRNHIAEVGGTR